MDRHTVLRAFLCVTVPETRPKHQKAGPTRRISGKKLRDDTLPESGNGGQSQAQMAETGAEGENKTGVRRAKTGGKFNYH